jgi:hypothetical protein
MTAVLVCATPEVESDLCHTLFWRDDLERYVLSQFPETVRFERGVITVSEVLGE